MLIEGKFGYVNDQKNGLDDSERLFRIVNLTDLVDAISGSKLFLTNISCWRGPRLNDEFEDPLNVFKFGARESGNDRFEFICIDKSNPYPDMFEQVHFDSLTSYAICFGDAINTPRLWRIHGQRSQSDPIKVMFELRLGDLYNAASRAFPSCEIARVNYLTEDEIKNLCLDFFREVTSGYTEIHYAALFAKRSKYFIESEIRLIELSKTKNEQLEFNIDLLNVIKKIYINSSTSQCVIDQTKSTLIKAGINENKLQIQNFNASIGNQMGG